MAPDFWQLLYKGQGPSDETRDWTPAFAGVTVAFLQIGQNLWQLVCTHVFSNWCAAGKPCFYNCEE